ncbi:MAG: hypothetical protein Q8P62_05440 [Candidatus Peregrinibacteria bacterium]|nr:hypothetical protein [Candidatus Peregrinibacteria bacterium]
MNLSPESIKEFQEIYKKELGKEITKEEAEEMGNDLLSLYSLICKTKTPRGTNDALPR